jgi:hypothetical protein
LSVWPTPSQSKSMRNAARCCFTVGLECVVCSSSMNVPPCSRPAACFCCEYSLQRIPRTARGFRVGGNQGRGPALSNAKTAGPSKTTSPSLVSDILDTHF